MPNLLPATTITAPVSATVTPWVTLADLFEGVATHLALQANFIYGSSGGTTVTVYVQTSLDGGTTAIDIACFEFTTLSARKVANLSSMTPVTTLVTPTDGTMSNNTVQDGIIGDVIRVKYVSTGTYVGATTIGVDCAI